MAGREGQDWNALAGHILLGLAGIPFMAFIVLPEDLGFSMLALGMYMAGAAAIVSAVRSVKSLAASLALMLGALLAFAINPKLWIASVVLNAVASLLAFTGNRAAGVAGLATIVALAVDLSPYSYKWLLLSGYIALISLASFLLTRRIHSVSIGAAALAPLFLDHELAMIIATATLYYFIYFADILGASRCPFRVDEPTMLSSVPILLIGLLLWLGGFTVYAKPVLAAGLVVLASAFLRPVSPEYSSTGVVEVEKKGGLK
ncbi:hypothetical protein APE_1880.1 [Aeropyrum pernix K1]|uniref:Uncharacterized protein n=1 Tax=Aeropyrum pernix (strain ATCC 700893 / DSM 11879 / JCM 9820 / NBRC 100138 / K1) TaxID=272557 RepID=Q9YAR3_AERPE|nr:hypothetical protein [Aeropyrum pernix]BAA80885.2 hypothetical protein APE_1880.1 [Aeropyrum pernix K1]